jgi:hypothetical protein
MGTWSSAPEQGVRSKITTFLRSLICVCCLYFCNSFVLLSVGTLNPVGSTFQSTIEW